MVENPDRLFIGDIPSYLDESHFREMLEPFGEATEFVIAMDFINNVSRGFGFVAFKNKDVTPYVIEAMNGMDFGGKSLLVDYASSGVVEKIGINLAQMVMPSLVSADLIVAGASANLENPSNILQILNLVTIDDLMDDEEFEEIRKDVEEICAKFGRVNSVIIPRPVMGQNVLGVGKVREITMH